MAIPDKRGDLISFGYSKLNDSRCSGCGADVEWWETPRKKKMPFVVSTQNGIEVLTPHWADCPNAASFRKGRK